MYTYRYLYIAKVLCFENPHDVGGVLSVWVGTVLVGENQAGVRLVNLGQEE